MRTVFSLALLAALASGCGSAPPLYTSAPATPATTIDGDARDWPAALRPVPNEAGLSLGLRNTADSLYVVVVASDERQARRIALGGLRLWLDPAGGTDRVLGLRFPAPAAPDPADVRRERARARTGGVDEQALRRRFRSSLDRVEVTREGDVLVRSVPRGSVDGLVTEAAWTDAGLVVEARLPLHAAAGLLPTDAAEDLGLGVELLDIGGLGPVGPYGAAGPRPGPQGAERPETSVEDRPSLDDLPTLTRWLRADLAA